LRKFAAGQISCATRRLAGGDPVVDPSSRRTWLRGFGGKTAARASRRRAMRGARKFVRVVQPEVVRFVELERGEPEQLRGLCFVTAESMRVPPVCVSDYLAALANQPPCLAEINRIGLTSMCVGRDGKQCEADGE
jgi:hypothetical protein